MVRYHFFSPVLGQKQQKQETLRSSCVKKRNIPVSSPTLRRHCPPKRWQNRKTIPRPCTHAGAVLNIVICVRPFSRATRYLVRSPFVLGFMTHCKQGTRTGAFFCNPLSVSSLEKKRRNCLKRPSDPCQKRNPTVRNRSMQRRLPRRLPEPA